MSLDELAHTVGKWLSPEGPEAEIVVSSRARLARNLASYEFTPRMTDDGRAQLERRAREAIEKAAVASPGFYVDLFEASPLDRKFLVERRLISREHEEAAGQRGVAIGDDERVSVMVNEEDHLRMQVIVPGLAVGEAWKRLDEADTALAEILDFAFHPQFGYLTACPTNVGTGLRVSVMLHLPALAITRQIDKVFHVVARLSLTVRGLYGEGTEATGHFYQISNQSTLGKKEEQIVQSLEAAVPPVLEFERAARRTLAEKDRNRLEDRAWRAYGMLRNARVVSSDEALAMLSALKMAVHMGVVPNVSPALVNEMILFTQPAHLQKRQGRELEPTERDLVRAEYLRGCLSEAERS